MSELGLPPPTSLPVQPTWEPEKPEHDIPMWVIWTALVVMVLGGGLVAFALYTQMGSDDEPKASYPATWDARIEPFVRATEKERKLTFLHPVAVRFLPDAEFEKTVRTDEEELDADDKADIRRTTGLLRALGLISGDVDLLAAFNDTHGSSTLAYYSFEDERITIRGTELSLAAHATLVHELTHALQDQHFGVGKKFEELADDDTTTSEPDVLRALVEGDAERTAQLYRDALPAAERKQLVAAEAANEKKLGNELPDVPKVVLAMVGAPYALGQALVDTVAQEGAAAGIDNLLRQPPTHDAVLLDPFEALGSEPQAVKVTAPKAAAGEKKYDAGEFGAVTWYLMLAERLPTRDALDAVDGWGGDAFVAFERGKQSCVRIAYAGLTADDAAQMQTALQRWQDAVPGTPASTKRDGDQLIFETCDPGTAGRAGSGSSTDALGLAVNRTYLALGMAKQGAPTKAARCLAGKMIDTFTLAELGSPDFAKDAAIQAKLAQMGAGCR